MPLFCHCVRAPSFLRIAPSIMLADNREASLARGSGYRKRTSEHKAHTKGHVFLSGWAKQSSNLLFAAEKGLPK